MRGILIGARQVSQRACLGTFGMLGRQHAGKLVPIAHDDRAPCRGQRKKAREQIDLGRLVDYHVVEGAAALAELLACVVGCGGDNRVLPAKPLGFLQGVIEVATRPAHAPAKAVVERGLEELF